MLNKLFTILTLLLMPVVSTACSSDSNKTQETTTSTGQKPSNTPAKPQLHYRLDCRLQA